MDIMDKFLGQFATKLHPAPRVVGEDPSRGALLTPETASRRLLAGLRIRGMVERDKSLPAPVLRQQMAEDLALSPIPPGAWPCRVERTEPREDGHAVYVLAQVAGGEEGYCVEVDDDIHELLEPEMLLVITGNQWSYGGGEVMPRGCLGLWPRGMELPANMIAVA